MQILEIIGRILFGGYFIYSGYNHLAKLAMLKDYAKYKKVPAPTSMVLISGLMILLGGLGVLFNLYAKISLILIAIFLLIVTFAMHNFWMDKDQTTKANNQVNFGKNLALLGACLLMIGLN